MRKFLTVCCAVTVVCSTLVNPFQTYDIHAEDNITMTEEDLAFIQEARDALHEIREEHTIMALVYLSDVYPVRAEASFDSNVVVNVPSGQQVLIEDIAVDDDFYENQCIWELVSFAYQGTEYRGYIPRDYLACSDEIFLEWENAYGMNPAASVMMAEDIRQASAHADVEQFPESYRAALNALKAAHPNWTFVKMNTGLNWSDVVYNEMQGGRSLIPSSFPAYMQNGLYSKSWAYATKEALEYYLDPRNWLTEDYIFQFEQLTYNESYHTEAAVQTFLNSTFMAGNIPGVGKSYARSFWEIGKNLGVSPFHLACRVYQEQGQGTSPLISGTYPGYEGYYNYFNVGATGTTDKAIIESGLKKAKEEGWTNPYLSIQGGARVISANYILKGQDTLYLQKFDVDSSYNGLYWHQYMQNICAPSSEGYNIRKLYASTNALDNTFVFKIPVYNDMPGMECVKPSASHAVSITAPDGYDSTTVYLDGAAYSAVMQDGRLVVTAPDADAKTAVLYRYNESGIPVGMYVWELSHDGNGYTATPVPELENLLTYHGFSIRIVGKAGIRFKTGISEELRTKLLGSGTAGYTLKEYGTLVMNNANIGQHAMVKDGEKVLSGLSYGIDANGNKSDKIYETVNGRHRFTSVLVGMPAEQYKTEYAFRGYIVLNKNGEDVVLYGPIVARSIYSLAHQILDNGTYEAGSSAYEFLHQLIYDADHVAE